MTRSADHKVAYRAEWFISDIAKTCRKIATVPGSKRVNLQTLVRELQDHGVESIARIPHTKLKGRLTVELVDDNDDADPAYVKFRPRLTMVVQRSVWNRFLAGHDKEQVIIGHEIGHIMLHDDDAKPFSRDESLQVQYAENEESAEWQANCFVDHLLAPTDLVRELKTVWRIAFTCNVPESFAEERIAAVAREKEILRSWHSGEPCPSCGDFGLSIDANGRRCNCGYSKRSPS